MNVASKIYLLIGLQSLQIIVITFLIKTYSDKCSLYLLVPVMLYGIEAMIWKEKGEVYD